MIDHRLQRWPPYVVVLFTLIALQVAFAAVMYLAIAIAVSRGLLPGIPHDVYDLEDAMEVAIGDRSKQLALSIAVNSIVLSGIAVAATLSGLTEHRALHLVRRLRLQAPTARDLAVAILGLLGLTTALDAIVELIGLHDFGSLAEMRQTLSHLTPIEQLLFAALIGIGPGVTEELLFRGYLFNRISATQGPLVALATSSIFFGMFHLDAVHIPLAMTMGFYLGFCLLRTGSLWVPIFAHTANNALATATTEWTPSDLQAGLLVPLGLIACASALTLLSRNARPLAQWPAVW